MAQGAETFGQQLDLRGFAAAFRALECDETTFGHFRFTMDALRTDPNHEIQNTQKIPFV
jgi:hypothetical protein